MRHIQSFFLAQNTPQLAAGMNAQERRGSGNRVRFPVEESRPKAAGNRRFPEINYRDSLLRGILFATSFLIVAISAPFVTEATTWQGPYNNSNWYNAYSEGACFGGCYDNSFVMNLPAMNPSNWYFSQPSYPQYQTSYNSDYQGAYSGYGNNAYSYDPSSGYRSNGSYSVYDYSTPLGPMVGYPTGDTIPLIGGQLCNYPGYGRYSCNYDPSQRIYDYWTGTWY